MNLYELSQAYVELQRMMEETDIEPAVIADTLDSIQEPLNQKAENIIKLIQKFNNDDKIITEEIKRLTEKRQSVRRQSDNLKQYLRDTLDMLPEPKVKTPIFSIWVQNNPPSLDIKSEEHIPQSYYIKQPDKLDRRSLLNDIRNGEEIEGVNVTQSRGVRYR